MYPRRQCESLSSAIGVETSARGWRVIVTFACLDEGVELFFSLSLQIRVFSLGDWAEVFPPLHHRERMPFLPHLLVVREEANDLPKRMQPADLFSSQRNREKRESGENGEICECSSRSPVVYRQLSLQERQDASEEKENNSSGSCQSRTESENRTVAQEKARADREGREGKEIEEAKKLPKAFITLPTEKAAPVRLGSLLETRAGTPGAGGSKARKENSSFGICRALLSPCGAFVASQNGKANTRKRTRRERENKKERQREQEGETERTRRRDRENKKERKREQEGEKERTRRRDRENKKKRQREQEGETERTRREERKRKDDEEEETAVCDLPVVSAKRRPREPRASSGACDEFCVESPPGGLWRHSLSGDSDECVALLPLDAAVAVGRGALHTSSVSKTALEPWGRGSLASRKVERRDCVSLFPLLGPRQRRNNNVISKTQRKEAHD
uniref:WDR8 protein isoform 3 family protein n=1 Tax=Toxoplasma gondii TgCATBr9 TaxID=943120 RepID=A0A2T6IEX3_TOXGO|nr:WDR8 protein isoform 3 family protein [Toxoplasma gondii TgCATBr9]